MQKLCGKGQVFSRTGQSAAVEYTLYIDQEIVRVKTLDNPGGSIVPGHKSITGRITPSPFSDESQVVLQIEDGSKFIVIYTASSACGSDCVAYPKN